MSGPDNRGYRKHSLDDQINRVKTNIRDLEIRVRFITTRKDKDAIKETIVFLQYVLISLKELKELKN